MNCLFLDMSIQIIKPLVQPQAPKDSADEEAALMMKASKYKEHNKRSVR
jgi:hypothetical protein